MLYLIHKGRQKVQMRLTKKILDIALLVWFPYHGRFHARQRLPMARGADFLGSFFTGGKEVFIDLSKNGEGE
jgi:hypothetical protein